jgi:hypothetical protein
MDVMGGDPCWKVGQYTKLSATTASSLGGGQFAASTHRPTSSVMEGGIQTGKQTASSRAKLLKYRCSMNGTPCSELSCSEPLE